MFIAILLLFAEIHTKMITIDSIEYIKYRPNILLYFTNEKQTVCEIILFTLYVLYIYCTFDKNIHKVFLETLNSYTLKNPRKPILLSTKIHYKSSLISSTVLQTYKK